MANSKHIQILNQGRQRWNRWRLSDLRYGPDLSGIQLKNTGLQWFDLRGVNLSGACLQAADLSDAMLDGAILRNADLTGAFFSRASLGAVYITKADLSNADFSFAEFGGTTVSAVDLSQTKGLDKTHHWVPSSIDARTLEETAEGLSRDPSRRREIETFYRRAGVSEHLIEYYGSRIGKPLKFHSCFISYSRSDSDFAQLLYSGLQQRGIRCWLDVHNILPGDNIQDAVTQGIRFSDKVLLCCSEESLSSWWVEAEIEAALAKERELLREHKQRSLVLIPLDLDGYLLSGKWKNGKAVQVTSRLAANFTGWRTRGSLQDSEFKRLVAALRTRRS
jgi:hypothetical protein